MSIASTQTTVDTKSLMDYALAIHRAGFNVVPMRPASKVAIKTWKLYTKRPQTDKEVLALPWDGNIAIVNGINHIRSIDIDRCDDPNTLFKVLELLGLDYEYPWIVRTPGKGIGGFHIYLLCPDALSITDNGVIVGYPLAEEPDAKFGQIELRWSNCLTMFPPSIHPDVPEAYGWLCGAPQTGMATVPLAVVEKAFLTVATPHKEQKEEGEETTTSQGKIVRYDLWADRALDQELGKVREAGEGGRNTQLNRSAFALGQIVAVGLLDAQEVTDELLRAAGAAGLEDEEATATIRSGLDAGRQKPRMPRQVFKDNEPPWKLPPARKADDEKIASFSADDQGHAEAVHHLYGPYIAYNNALGWMVWNGTHFVPSIARINSLIVSVLRMRLRAAAHLERTDLAKVSRAMAGTVSATRSLLENLADVDVQEFDAEPDLINCLSGVVNLRTKTLIPHDPAYRFTWCSPVRYNPDANSDLWLDFLSETLETGDMLGYLQQALGYSITGHTSEEVLFYIFGPPRSGKGTLSETILSIFPRPIVSEVDFNSFTAKREADTQNFDLAPLKPARLVFASESNKYQSLNPAKVKALTGGNLVTCAFKHKDPFSYKPQYAVWLSSNHEVNADADDDALWGRVKVIHFPNSRLGREDKTLKRRMQSPENLEAVLAWLVEGAYQWYQREGRGLETPESVRDNTRKQRADQDSVGLWLLECCEMGAEYWTSNTHIRTSYENWCKDNGYEPKKANGFSRSLAAHRAEYPFLEVGILQRFATDSGGTKPMRGVRGLRLL